MKKKEIPEQVLEQPTLDAQQTYLSLVSNDATEVQILRTSKKYKVRWLKNGQLEKLTRLLIKAGKTDNVKSSGIDALDEILQDCKLACKAAAIITLNGYWSVKFRYWLRWRWFYYIRQYDNIQLDAILDIGKKKVPLMQYYRTIMSLTEAKDSLMRMRAKEVEATLQELSMAQRSQTESNSSGS
jgi:hypothetical protein